MIRSGQNGARPGRVIELTADGYYIVEIGGGQVPAYLSDQATDAAVEIGTVVTVLPMVGGFEIVSARTGPSGSGGLILGTELIANNSFESGALGEAPAGWEPFWVFGATSPLVGSEDTPLAGSRVGMVTIVPGDEPDDSGLVVYRISRNPSRIDPATIYRLSAYCSARVVAGTSVSVSVSLLTAPTEVGCNYFQPTSVEQVAATLAAPGEAWPLLSGDVTVPTGHTWFRPIFRVQASPGSDLTIRWDSVSLRQRLT